MKKTYLFRLYRYDKKWFYFIAIFAGLSILCNMLGNETTPFFVWGMYSENITPQKNYNVIRTTVNDTVAIDTYSGYSDNTRMFLNAPLAYYQRIKEAHADPSVIFLKDKLKANYGRIKPLEKRLFNAWPVPGFMNWYRCYLEKVSGMNIHAVRIDMLAVRFNEGEYLVMDSSYLLETWRQQ